MIRKEHLWRFVGLTKHWAAAVLGGMVGGLAMASQPPLILGDGVWEITAASYVDTRDVLVGDPAAVFVGSGAAATLTGQVVNVPGSSEGVIKLGAGSLTLAGQNSYQGVTRVLQGELVAGHDQAMGVGGVQVNTGATLTMVPGVTLRGNVQLDAADMQAQPIPPSYTVDLPGKTDSVRWHVADGQARHAGVLTGQAAFEKTGAGRLSLDQGALGYTGAAVVKEGTLAVNDLFGGTVQVGAGARLEGTGSIASVWVREGGTLAPGASIGVLRIPGDLRFDAGSTLSVEVAPDGRHDTLIVGGQATLAGDVQALAEAGDWQPATHYKFLTASGGLGGTRFDGVNSNFAFLTPSLSYDETSVTLTLARNDTALSAPAASPQAAAVADAVAADAPGSDPGVKDLPRLYDAIVVLDRDSAGQAYDDLTGVWPASVRVSLLEDSRFVREAVLDSANRPDDRIRHAMNASTVAQNVQTQTSGFWATGYESRGRASAVKGAPGYMRSLRGLTVGSRHLFNRVLTLGGFVGLQHRHVAQRQVEHGASTSLRSVHVGADAEWQAESFRVHTGVAAEWHDVQNRRFVSLGRAGDALRSAYRSRVLQWFGAVVMGPLDLRWAMLHQRSPAHTESGGQSALRYAAVSEVAAYASLGLNAMKSFRTALGKGMVHAELAWRYGWGQRGLTSDYTFRDSKAATVLQARGQGVTAHALRARVTVSTQLGRQGQLQVGYSGVLAPGWVDHGVMLQIRQSF